MILTIVTPLSGLDKWDPAEIFKSMCGQAFGDFEWLIASDGTVPDARKQTEEIKRQFHRFRIRFIETPYRGRHRCINLAAREARGNWLLELEPGLKLTENCLSPLCHTLRYQQQETIGIICPRVDCEGKPQGKIPSDKEMKGNLINMVEKDKSLSGYYCLCLRRDIILKNLYPEFEEEEYMPPALMLYRMSYSGNMKFEDIPLGIPIEEAMAMPETDKSPGRLGPASMPAINPDAPHRQPLIYSSPKGWMTFAKDLCGVDEIAFCRKMSMIVTYWECRRLLSEPIPTRRKDKRTAEQEMLLNTEYMQSFKSTAYLLHKVLGWFGKGG